MDIKIAGLSLEIMETALEKARKGRLHILGEMNKVMATPRDEMSPYAPRIFTIQIKPDKIGDVIGPKGKTIRGIQDASGAKVNIDDTGLITIAAVGAEAGARRARWSWASSPSRSRDDLHGPGQEHDGIRRVHRDHAGRRRAAATSRRSTTSGSRRPRTSSRRGDGHGEAAGSG